MHAMFEWRFGGTVMEGRKTRLDLEDVAAAGIWRTLDRKGGLFVSLLSGKAVVKFGFVYSGRTSGLDSFVQMR